MNLWPVLAASLVGSPHCAAMCGLIAAGAGREPRARSAYHLGRLAGYVALGGLAGSAGFVLDQAGTLAGIVDLTTRLAGAMLVLAGITTILAARGVRVGSSGRVHRGVVALGARLAGVPPVRRAAGLGLITALLPCGWLVAFVAVAAATGRPGAGALTMATFWFGTVPGLATAGALIQSASGPLRRWLPLISATALIVLGVVTAVARPTRHIDHTPPQATHEPSGR